MVARHISMWLILSIPQRNERDITFFFQKEGKETFIISSKKGQRRLTLTKGKGIELVNELGGIRIKCRKLRIAGGRETGIQAKKLKVSSGGTMRIHSGGKTQMKCGGEIKFRGKNINLRSSKGITAEGKQMAAAGDKVMGFDIHNMHVPSASGTTVVPLPHPFIGKLAEGLSDNVKINGHNAATKGSRAKHDDPVHNQLPGTVKFDKGPAKEGEVTGGTAKSVKINGREAAVTGSTVTTCNDTGAKDNSVIMAPGTWMPMPVIINPKNTKDYLLEREAQEKRHPEFTQARWGKAKVKEGEELELLADVRDIADGNMVTFQVWKEGQDPNTHIALAQIPAAIEGGTAKGRWKYRLADAERVPEEDPEFYFTAHSAWCPFKKSESVTVELKRPELTNAQWKDKEGNQTGKGLAGEELKLCVSCNEGMEEGAGVIFRVYAEGADVKRDQPVAEIASTKKDGKAEAEWRPEETREAGDTKELRVYFTVSAGRTKQILGAALPVRNPRIVEMKWDPEAIYYGDKTKLLIKTFEVSEFSPSATVKISYTNSQKEEICVYEEEEG
jgi:uncharacterized Zn-binding protein involved in type VI secretion